VRRQPEQLGGSAVESLGVLERSESNRVRRQSARQRLLYATLRPALEHVQGVAEARRRVLAGEVSLVRELFHGLVWAVQLARSDGARHQRVGDGGEVGDAGVGTGLGKR
jgi:hypothetical protein